MRVVIADDEPLARALLRALLEEGGVEIVAEAQDGAEAVAMVERFRPDAVFLDVDMPGRSGMEAAREVQVFFDTPIVFLTAHPPHAIDAFELGAADYILKPLQRERLRKALDRLAARPGERGHTEPPPPDDAGNREQRLKAAFGLTVAEAEVALRLADGVAVKQIAQERNTSEGTVRTQLKTIASKMGCSRQVEILLRTRSAEGAPLSPFGRR